MLPHDPNGELRPIDLDGRLTGAEAIAYAPEVARPLGEVCVDAASLAGAESARWICFDSHAGSL